MTTWSAWKLLLPGHERVAQMRRYLRETTLQRDGIGISKDKA
ncbi:MAG: hypothetical protein U1E77_22070 [Inhella sp.]